MPPDPFTDRPPLRPDLAARFIERRGQTVNEQLDRIGRKVDAGEPVDIEPGGYRSFTADEADRLKALWKAEYGTPEKWNAAMRRSWTNAHADFIRDHGEPWKDPELDEWRTTYGRLDIPVRVIDWRPIAAGIAALTLAAIAHRMVRR